MLLDPLLTRAHPLLIAGLVGVAAWLQASGVTSLVGAEIGAPPPDATGRPTLGAAGATRPAARVTAAPILARNPFDSTTGRLDGRSAPTPVDDEPGASFDPADPPACSTGEVTLITESGDPAFSFAVIKAGAETQLRRVGDDVQGKKVQRISWDRIWIGSGSSACVMRLGRPGAAGAAAGGDDRSAKLPPSLRERTAGMGGDAPLGAGVRRVGENSYVLEGPAAEHLRSMQSEMMKGARVAPGKGVRLSSVKAGSPLAQLGFEKGDLIKTINGQDMTDPDQAVEAYGRLKTARRVEITLERGGADRSVDFEVK